MLFGAQFLEIWFIFELEIGSYSVKLPPTKDWTVAGGIRRLHQQGTLDIVSPRPFHRSDKLVSKHENREPRAMQRTYSVVTQSQREKLCMWLSQCCAILCIAPNRAALSGRGIGVLCQNENRTYCGSRSGNDGLVKFTGINAMNAQVAARRVSGTPAECRL